MSDVFGFDEAIQDLERYSSRANNINEKVYQEGIKMRDDARNIARGLGLYKTGKGVSGIDIERVSNGVEIGWSNRPNFHLFFHEFGFHATGRKKVKDIHHDQVKVNESVDIRQVQYTYHQNHI